MAPKTSEQYREIRESRRKQILETALQLFAEQGYTHTSVRMIAEQAGISKGLLYNYFKSKEELLDRIIQEGFEEILKDFDPDNDGTLTREELGLYIDRVFESLRKNRNYFNLLFALMIQPQVMSHIIPLYESKIASVFTMVADYFGRTGFEDPMSESMLFLAHLDGIAFHYIVRPEEYPLDKVAEALKKRYIK
ncbi:MAG: hypothetical protein Kow00127_09050 [Bacteroidales bacterium]